MEQPVLQIEQLSKFFTTTPAVHNISLTLKKGEILCLLGPSGCGKTTLLRSVAGLETPDTGAIFFTGQDITRVPPHQRDFGLMFQEFALFPHKDVGQNVAFGLQMKKVGDVETRIKEMLALVGLSGFEDRDVSSLSGGERQRVALARSLAPNPRLLMLDEPLGALDRALRERLMLEIRQILKRINLTAIYVTHDQSEAFAVADRIVVMNNGQIEQNDTPEQLYRRPATPFVARFLGFANLFEATCLEDGQIDTDFGVWPVVGGCRPNEEVMLLVRPEAAQLDPTDGGIPLEGEVISTLFRGRFYQITVAVAGRQLTFELPFSTAPLSGKHIKFWLEPTSLQLLPFQKPG